MEWCPCISVHKGASAPIFDDSEPLRDFKIGGNMECLVEMVQIENSFRNVNFTLWNRFSWAFLKTLKPMSFRGLRPLDPRCHNGILDRNSTIDNSVQNYMWILPLIFSLAFNVLKPTSFWQLNPWIPGTMVVEYPTLNLLWKWYKLRIHYKITSEFYPRFYPHKQVF